MQESQAQDFCRQEDRREKGTEHSNWPAKVMRSDVDSGLFPSVSLHHVALDILSVL